MNLIMRCYCFVSPCMCNVSAAGSVPSTTCIQVVNPDDHLFTGVPVDVAFPASMTTQQRAWLSPTAVPLRSITLSSGDPAAHDIVAAVSYMLCFDCHADTHVSW